MNIDIWRMMHARFIAVLVVAGFALAAGSPVALADETPPSDDPEAIIADLRTRDENNVAAVFNRTDGAFLTEGSAAIDYQKGKQIDAVNVGWAQSSCVDCSSMAVAFQILLFKPKAQDVSPANIGAGLNIECTNCYSYGFAKQIAFPVDHPKHMAREYADEMAELDAQIEAVLANVASGAITTSDAELQLDGLALELDALADEIKADAADDRDDDDDDDDGDRHDGDDDHSFDERGAAHREYEARDRDDD